MRINLPTWTIYKIWRMAKFIPHKNSNFIILFATFSSALLILVYKLLSNFPQAVDQGVLSYYVDRYGSTSSKYQVAIFTIYLCMLALTALAIASSSGFKSNQQLPSSDKKNLIVLVVGFCLFSLFTFLFSEYSLEFRSGFFVAFAIVLIIKICSLSEKIKFNQVKKFVNFAFLGFFSAYVIFPFFTPPIFNSNSLYLISNEHYSALISPGYDLSCCGKLNNSFYGLGTAFIVAFTLKVLNLLPLNEEYLPILVVRLFQVVAIFLIFIAARLANKKNYFLIGSITILLTSKINSAGSGIYYPNQSGLRISWFLIGLIAIIQISKRKSRRLLSYSLICATLIVLNFDTGTMTSAGIMTIYVLQESPKPRKNCGPFFLFLFIFISTIFLTFLLVFVTKFFIGGYTSPLSIFLGQQDVNSQISKLNVSAVFFLFFGTIYFLRGFSANSQIGSKTVKHFQSATAAMLLFSLFYYFSRMSRGNLWFQVILFIFMISPSINSRIFQMIRSNSPKISALAITTFCFAGGLGFSNAFSLYQDTYYSYLTLYRSECDVKISVFQTPCNLDEDPVVISEYVSEAKTLSKTDNSIIISILPSTIKIAGFNRELPWDDFRPTTESSYEKWITWFSINKPEILLLDNPNSNISLERPNEVKFKRMILGSLPNYRRESTSYYWERYRIIDSPHKIQART